jgi:LEA14-like dessication related protein
VILVIGFYSYSQYEQLKAVKQLKIGFEKAQVEKLSLTHADFVLTFSVQNPNEIDVNIGKFNAKFTANGLPLTELHIPEAVLFTANETQKQDVPLRLHYFDAGRIILNAYRQGNLDWNIEGSYEMQLPLGMTYEYKFG